MLVMDILTIKKDSRCDPCKLPPSDVLWIYLRELDILWTYCKVSQI